ncbi:arylsulfatase precursor [Fusarium austroafricanum]|uniref:Arylsulfatase n=1 Tax=Fusarium austroafricanum TaxID=2364996 RepID=A0A8H4KIA1_9HYPO|nr:arylsulfatase precursor [Fusarium austroafricanum]
MQLQLAFILFAGLVQAKQPNILFILTDDQDLHMESTTYNQHYCTVALCYPSRATLWTGKAAHNHNITNVSPPHGGYPKIADVGINDDYLFLRMQDAGYNTYYSGKLWNFHGVSNYDRPYARSFNASDFLLDPYTYRYWESKMSHNGEPPVSYAGKYSTDVAADKAYKLLDDALDHKDLWFLTVAPIAPNSNWVFDEKNNKTYLSTPQSAYRHEHLFHDYKIPRGKSFNSRIEGAAGWPGRLDALNESVILYNDHYQRQRLRSLQAVDEMLHELIQKIEAAGEIDNTYIFYSTDNGYHISQHRMHPGKECGFDTDIHISMFIRGPGVKEGGQIDVVTTHSDIASTILKLAGVDKQTNGEVMPLIELEQTDGRIEHAAIEYWGHGMPEGHYGFSSDENFEVGKFSNYYVNNTYKGLRMASQDFSLYYSIWCTGERELFNLKDDPEQTINLLSGSYAAQLAADQFTISKRPLHAIVDRLDALVMAMKACKDKACSRPWKELHPNGRISPLHAALNTKFDAFYAGQPKMYFDSCEAAFIKEKESNEPIKSWHEPGLRKAEEYDYGAEWILVVQVI